VLRFAIRRLLWLIPSLVLVTFTVYCALRIGTNPLNAYLRTNPRASAAKQAEYVRVNGLYDGLNGYARGYFEWLWRFVRGPDSWPRSIRGRARIYPGLKDALTNTLRLGVAASVIGIGAGLVIGTIASLKPGKALDSTINTGAFIVGAIPPFVSAVLLQLLFAVKWGDWFGSPLLPPSGRYPAGHTPSTDGFWSIFTSPGAFFSDLWLTAKYMILPVSVVAIQGAAGYSRYMRASLLDVKSSDYMRTARAKGLSERRVLLRHGLRNALIPITTLLALDAGLILGGLIITENIFEYPGMGRYFLIATQNGDFPQLMPWMVIIVLSVLLFNLLADLSYAVLDPRIRLD